MTKGHLKKPPMQYQWVDEIRRTTLISRVAEGWTIGAAARSLQINYGNAKCIISSDRKRRAKGICKRKLRGPRFQKIFAVIKSKKRASAECRAVSCALTAPQPLSYESENDTQLDSSEPGTPTFLPADDALLEAERIQIRMPAEFIGTRKGPL